MTTRTARIVTAAPLGDLDALDAGKAQIEAAKLRFRVLNKWGSRTHS